MRELVNQPSRKQIRKAASVLRHWWRDDDPNASEEVYGAWQVVSDFRTTFQRPLDKVTIQLRRFVAAETDSNVVAQRLKRLPTILDKLGRQPSMDITRMQDIGGARAVLPTIAESHAVLARIGSHWNVTNVNDYVDEPKASGYRALHAVVLRDERLIEIQLRTAGQHAWAVAVEKVGPRLGASVKDGQGPDSVLKYFQLAGKGIALAEEGKTADDDFQARFQALSEQVTQLLARTE